MRIETYTCECGMEFEAACLSELEGKLNNHKCAKINKRVARTQALKQRQEALFIDDLVTNRIEEHNFDKLIQQGVIV